MREDPRHTQSLSTAIEGVRDRLRNLEKSQRAAFTSITQGLFSLVGSGGVQLVRFGRFILPSGDSVFGFRLSDGNGVTLQHTNEAWRGMIYPNVPFPMRKPETVGVTSGTFVTIVEGEVQVPAYDSVSVVGIVTAPVSTTAELRLRTISGGHTTSVLSVPANTANFYAFDWTHPATCGWGDSRPGRSSVLGVVLEARRTSGTGTVNVQLPLRSELKGSEGPVNGGSNTNGNPRFL